MRWKMDVLCSDGVLPHAFCRILFADRQTDTDESVSQKKCGRSLNVDSPSAAPPWAQRLKPGESLTLYNPWVLLLFMLTKPASASGVRRINMKRSVCTHCTASSQIHRTQNSLFIISTQGRRVTQTAALILNCDSLFFFFFLKGF